MRWLQLSERPSARYFRSICAITALQQGFVSAVARIIARDIDLAELPRDQEQQSSHFCFESSIRRAFTCHIDLPAAYAASNARWSKTVLPCFQDVPVGVLELIPLGLMPEHQTSTRGANYCELILPFVCSPLAHACASVGRKADAAGGCRKESHAPGEAAGESVGFI